MEDFVTDVNLNLITNGSGNRLAWGNVVLFGKTRVNISITKSGKGEAFVSWPGFMNSEGKWVNNVSFVELDDYKYVNEAIMQSFNALIEGPAPVPAPKETVVTPKATTSDAPKKPSVWAKKK